MRSVLKISTCAFLLIAGTCIVALPRVISSDPKLNTVALVKNAPSETVIDLTGELVVKDGKYFLQDLTGKIELIVQRKILKAINADVGKTVKVAGEIRHGYIGETKLDETAIQVTKIKILHEINTCNDTEVNEKSAL